MGFVKKFTDKGIKVVDLSADYRIKNAALYKKWYKTIHKYPALLKKAVYGLPMLNRDKIKKADLVANPGCYATSVLLGVIPAAAEFSVDSVIADCKTGISGAGASPSPLSQYININENIIPYKYGRKHRHLAEIEEVLKGAAGKTPEVIFTPQIAALDRGILSVVYIKLKKWVDI